MRLTGGAADDLRSLHAWLVAEDELRGRVEFVEQSPAPGTLGSALDTLVMTLGPGGAASVLVAGLVSWIRSRHGDLDITVERRDDRTTFRVSARRVRGLDAASLRDELERFDRALTRPGAVPDRPAGDDISGPTGSSEADRVP